MCVGAVGGGKGVAVERGPQRDRANCVDDLEGLDVEVDASFDCKLALRAGDGHACRNRARRPGANQSSGMEDKNAAARLRKCQLHRGKARRRVEGPATATCNFAEVQGQRHTGAFCGHRLGERHHIHKTWHIPQKLAVRRKSVVAGVAGQFENLLVSHRSFSVGLALSLSLCFARVHRRMQQLGERRRVHGAFRFLHLSAEAVFDLYGCIHIGAEFAETHPEAHRDSTVATLPFAANCDLATTGPSGQPALIRCT